MNINRLDKATVAERLKRGTPGDLVDVEVDDIYVDQQIDVPIKLVFAGGTSGERMRAIRDLVEENYYVIVDAYDRRGEVPTASFLYATEGEPEMDEA